MPVLSSVRRFSAVCGFSVLAGVGAFAGPACAQELILRNDGLTDGGSVNICPCFAAGEEAAVWLTVPCDGTIVGFQVFWKSFLGGTLPSVEEAIKVYSAGTFPTAGVLRSELLAPALTDGGLNEYRFEDDNQTIPISIPVTGGETIVVSLQFFNANNTDPFLASVVSDNNGCQTGKNAVKLTNGQWRNACTLGVTGDWVIRAILECGTDPRGAVCLPDGTCAENLTELEAFALGGQWRGAGTTCAAVSCTGACFIPSTGACLDFTKPTCDSVGGQWQGPGTTSCDTACPADTNGDGSVNFADVQRFITDFNAMDPAADLTDDGVVNFADVQAFVTAFNAGC